MTFSQDYTSDKPTKIGYYWVFEKDYPVPQILFYQHDRLYGGGGYRNGVLWEERVPTGSDFSTKGHHYRSIAPLEAPDIYPLRNKEGTKRS